MSGHGAAQRAAYDAVGRQRQRRELLGMNAADRHRRLLADLARLHGGELPAPPAATAPARTDLDALREGYRFLRTAADDAGGGWEARLARRYYDRLYREYAIADLSRIEQGALGLRWRTQRELVAGTGQFTCGAKGCNELRGLASFEVPFAYDEAGARQRALVKLRLCPLHAGQLQAKKRQEAAAAKQAQRHGEGGSGRRGESKKRRRREERGRGQKKKRTKQRRSSGSGSDSPSSDSEAGARAGGPRADCTPGGGPGAPAEGGAAAESAGAAAAAPALGVDEEEDRDLLHGLFA